MRFKQSFLLFLILLTICGCHGCYRNVSDAILPSGGNPELISYLQGTWVLTADNRLTLKIKRDSLIESYNDSTKRVRNLSYLLTGTAEMYFTKDSAFDFSSQNGRTLTTDDFKLIENNESSGDTITHLLAYVSKSRLVINTGGKFANFKRAK